MAWSTPLTATASAVLTASQWNASVRDNLLETPVAKATTAGTIFVATGPTAIAERFILENVVDTSETTTSTSYTSLATNGPLVTVTTGAKALVFITSELANSVSGTSVASFEITGATSTAVSDTRGVISDSGANSHRGSVAALMPLTAGANTFRMLYRCTSSTSTFGKRRLQVIAL